MNEEQVEALRVLLEKGNANTSALQRYLAIGYAKAAAILDALEQKGFVSACGDDGRKLYITLAEFLELVKSKRIYDEAFVFRAQDGCGDRTQKEKKSEQSSAPSTPCGNGMQLPVVKVIGVGTNGVRMVDGMIRDNAGARFYAVAADEDTLAASKCDVKIRATADDRDALQAAAAECDIAYIVTAADDDTSPVLAQAAYAAGALTIAVVTLPDRSDPERYHKAQNLLEKLKKAVDCYAVIPCETAQFVLQDKPQDEISQAIDAAAEMPVQAIVHCLLHQTLVNLDIADVKAVLKNAGAAYFGTGSAEGVDKIRIAVKDAVFNPLTHKSLEGASKCIISIDGGRGLKIDEMSNAIDMIRYFVKPDANLIFCGDIKETLPDDQMTVTIVAAGF